MKQIFTLILSFFFIASSFAQKTAVKSGNWDDNNTWSNKTQPKNGDKVIIPNGIAVEIDDNEKLTNADFEVAIFGILSLDNGQFRIGGNSTITLYPSGRLVPTKGNGGEKVIIGKEEKYNGKQGILYGPLFAAKTTNGFQSFAFSVLPVQFSSFGVAIQNNSVLVQWSTVEETNASYFEVQRSTNGTDWSSIGQVAAAGNSSQLKQYSFTDITKVSGTVYYRIKQADVTGKTAYTAVKSIVSKTQTQINITSTNSNVAVQFGQPVKGKVDVLVVNRAGQVVARQTLQNPVGNVLLNTASLKGNYFVAIQSAAGISASKQVVL